MHVEVKKPQSLVTLGCSATCEVMQKYICVTHLRTRYFSFGKYVGTGT